MANNRFYLIGSFIADTRGYHSIKDENLVNLKEILDEHFMGIMEINSNGVHRGIIKDGYGYSLLLDVVFTEENLSFTKKYLARTDLIKFQFYKKGECWLGFYNGEFSGQGLSFCKIIPFVDYFLDRSYFQELIAKQTLH